MVAGGVPDDPFYDAAVRSMPLSLHNFLLGAYEPGGSLAVDKPPLDLWLQVLSTQLVRLRLGRAEAAAGALRDRRGPAALRRRPARARAARRASSAAWRSRPADRAC